ncbi:MAG: hypothetical protein K2P39_02485 [Lachnospiraceae bacterium]|nr:hypothetical protein [Lachnospiraceae bacterium]
MKQNRQREKVVWLILILSIITLALLLVVQIVKSVQDRGEEPPERVQEESQTETSEAPESTEQAESLIEPEEDVSARGYIIIGDSHAVVADGMGYSVQGSRVEGITFNKNLFIVHTGLDPVMGTIDWLEGDGAERIKEIISTHTELSRWSIISMHGTSMVTQPDIEPRYIQTYQKWIEESFGDCAIYFVSVPPLDEKAWVSNHPDIPARFNEDIVRFNARIEEAFPDQYFDYYDWFLARADSFLDEIHYTGETYCEMFDEILQKIMEK